MPTKREPLKNGPRGGRAATFNKCDQKPSATARNLASLTALQRQESSRAGADRSSFECSSPRWMTFPTSKFDRV